MHAAPVADQTPLFVVAGMFGNVLNLSHLAHLLGEERAFYALQARGLYGDAAPHETFEDMARDYIEEMRKVQPHGPYLVGGFSGGGITAYEIAKQLIAERESVLDVILLDTPLPRIPAFGLADRVSMLAQGMRKNGLSFVREKIKERIAWEKQQYLKRRENQKEESANGAQFQSRRIGDAFLRAVNAYRMAPVPVHVSLFRPKLDVRYRLSSGRLVDSERNLISPDNGWTPYVSGISIAEVPGDHDSMVLEPNVRVLVSALKRAIRAAEEGRALTARKAS
jgi:thioesterase domain-containing protein